MRVVSDDAAVAEVTVRPKLVCEPGTAAIPAPAPDLTWFCARPDGTRHGPFVTLFPDGTIATAGSHRDGALDGGWQKHHPSGAVAETGVFAANLPTGTWQQTSTTGAVLGTYALADGTGVEKRWLDDGTLYSEVALQAGARHGFAKTFARDGGVLVAARYSAGKLDGPYVAGSLRALRFEEKYSAGVRTGPRSIWQYGGLIAEESFDRRGKWDGPYTLWRSKKIARVKGQFAHGKRVGAWVWHDRDGNKEREGRYVDGMRDGRWIEWWANTVVFTGHYKAGKPDGEFAYFDRKGNELGKVTIKDGTGTLLTFWGNRKPSSKTTLVKGVEDGPYQELTQNGTVVIEGRYKAGAKHGVWKAWSPEGVLLVEQAWARGKLDGTVKKYVAGKLSLEATYQDGQASGPYVEHRDGKPVVTGQFVADRKHGTWTHHDPAGAVVRTATYKDGLLDGPWREVVADSVLEGTVVAGRRTGTWTRTDAAGVVRQLTYGPP